MSWIRVIAFAGLLTLSGCSYSYDVEAVMIDGRLAFVPDAASRGRAKCVSHVVVAPVEPAAGGARSAVWHDAGGHDCADRFPIFYGEPLKGEDGTPVAPEVAPQALRPGVVYEVVVTAGTTGYGGRKFRLTADGQVENLPRAQ